jgi:sugar phosphate isomerase/epimerase
MLIGAQAFPHGPSVFEMVPKIKKSKFDAVEIVLEFPNTVESFSPKERKRIQVALKESNLYATIHAPFSYLDSASPNKDVRAMALAKLVETFNIAEDIGAKIVTVHAPDYRVLLSEIVDAYVETIRALWAKVKSDKVKLAIENTLQNYRQFNNIISKINNREIAITYDVGHANLNGDPVKFLEMIPAERIVNVHLHDNFGSKDEHLPIGEGNIDFSAILNTLFKQGYNGLFIIEHATWFYYPKSKKKLKYLIKKTTKAMPIDINNRT